MIRRNAIRLISFAVVVFLSLPTLGLALTSGINFSDSEREWLKKHPTVTFTGDPNWLPYEAFNDKGEYIGIVSEHLKIISARTGIKFIMSPSKTWTESTNKAKQGLVDILSETDDSDLKSHLIFTNNYLSNPIVMVMRNSENYIDSISRIDNRQIALIRDYGYASKIRRRYSNIDFVTVDDIQHGLIAVSTGEVDALLCTLALCSYTISELGLNNVRIVGETEFDTKLALGVQKHLPELVSILNKAIDTISAGEKQSILDAWIKQKFAPKTDYTIVYGVVIVAAVLLGVFAYSNRRLSQEIYLRIAIEKDLKKAEEVLKISNQRLELHREQTPLGVIEFNTNFEIVYWNNSAQRIFGFVEEEVLGKHVTERILPDSALEEVDTVWRNLLEKKGGERSTNENVTKDGRTILCEWYNTPLVDRAGKVIGVTSLVDDITERKSSEEVIWRQANFDTLTGLPNRNMFHDRLRQEMDKSDRTNLPLALLLVDLDEFKEVNDTLGHHVGDRLLKETAHRISSCVRVSDTVARLGGDEFTIILSELHDINKVDVIAVKIIDKLTQEYNLGNEIVHISGSIGITFYPTDTRTVDSLMKNADQAMYAAKENGKNRFSYFTQSLQDNAQNRLRLTKDLRIAVDTNQFELYFQPIIDLRTNRIFKAEALLRWHHPNRGIINPLEFISIAENTGLINEIGDWVFRESARFVSHCRKNFSEAFQVTVNMSPVQFRSEKERMTDKWLGYLQEFKVSGRNIVIEITEGLLLNVESDVIDVLIWLRDTDIQVALDDFGTGYSSLSYLKEFDIDYLKIDQSFVRNLRTNKNDLALTEAIIVMAHKLGLKVIAEGVETEMQRNILTSTGCDYAQGFLFSKPVPSVELEKLLLQQKTDQVVKLHVEED